MNARWLLLVGAGFVVWSAAFVILYAMLSVGCRFGWDEVVLTGGITVQRAQLAAILVFHLVVLGALVLALRRPPESSFLRQVAYGTALAALAATIFSFAAVFALTPCA